ncbi:MAG: host attachment protein [Polyangiales bacterium]
MTTTPTPSAWILVAQSTHATFFSSRGSHTPMQLVATMENPRGRLLSRALDSDRPGRSFDRAGHGSHALANEVTAHEHAARVFAHQLAERLDRERCAGTFDQLIIFAGPRMLGMLREELSEPTRRLVQLEVHKELLNPTPEILRKQLRGMAHV